MHALYVCADTETPAYVWADGAPLTVISHGLSSSVIGCETTLKKNDAHSYKYIRKQRGELGFIWNSVWVRLNCSELQLCTTGCTTIRHIQYVLPCRNRYDSYVTLSGRIK